MKQLERMSFRPALRMGRRRITVYLEGGKEGFEVWSNYSLSRNIDSPAQKLPKVGHFSTPKAIKGAR